MGSLFSSFEKYGDMEKEDLINNIYGKQICLTIPERDEDLDERWKRGDRIPRCKNKISLNKKCNKRAVHILMPCRHRSICNECVQLYYDRDAICYLCSKKIKKIL